MDTGRVRSTGRVKQKRGRFASATSKAQKFEEYEFCARRHGISDEIQAQLLASYSCKSKRLPRTDENTCGT